MENEPPKSKENSRHTEHLLSIKNNVNNINFHYHHMYVACLIQFLQFGHIMSLKKDVKNMILLWFIHHTLKMQREIEPSALWDFTNLCWYTTHFHRCVSTHTQNLMWTLCDSEHNQFYGRKWRGDLIILPSRGDKGMILKKYEICFSRQQTHNHPSLLS